MRYLTEPEYSSLLFSAIQLSSEIFVVCGKKDLHSCWFYAIIIELSVRVLWQRYAAVAQLDRVTGYEPVGRGFESLQPYQLVASVISLATSFLCSASKTHLALILLLLASEPDSLRWIPVRVGNKNIQIKAT